MTRKIIIMTGIAIILLWLIGRTNIIQLYSTPSSSNHPTLKINSYFFASNLTSPKRFDFICYYTPEQTISVHRLCGIEGDTIEIKNGNLFVNNSSVNNNFTLSHNYIFISTDYKNIKEADDGHEEIFNDYSSDSITRYISDESAQKLGKKVRRVFLPNDYPDEKITQKYLKPWNQEHFGPIVVPQGNFFLLGDNRLNSFDSRYIGFVDKSNFLGTVLFH